MQKINCIISQCYRSARVENCLCGIFSGLFFIIHFQSRFKNKFFFFSLSMSHFFELVMISTNHFTRFYCFFMVFKPKKKFGQKLIVQCCSIEFLKLKTKNSMRRNIVNPEFNKLHVFVFSFDRKNLKIVCSLLVFLVKDESVTWNLFIIQQQRKKKPCSFISLVLKNVFFLVIGIVMVCPRDVDNWKGFLENYHGKNK